ncbi:M61 family metallopeptidase [Brumimicrobium oceani]|uniref:Peptidase M61 catalytic domain-containing protein n=1 Tax=Brumimicrobium oceani TaxID=2100725 RepID=A0A2U2XDN8_9FLAO|nr:hypothetical protein [Brumimicrobium oceani]PWH85929.1 hypothetical protein DIT68_07510 [Brumimicrobium oceani]
MKQSLLMKPITGLFIVFLFQIILASSIFGQATNNVVIDLSKEITNDKIQVEIHDLNFKKNRDTLFFPAVVLGMYEENNFGQYIDEIKVSYVNGDIKTIKSTKQNLFILKDAAEVTKVSYWAKSTINNKSLFLPAGSFFEQHGAFLLNFHSLVPYSKSTMNNSYKITIKRNNEITAVGALPIKSIEEEDKDIITAADYHELIDSPFLYSKFKAKDTTSIRLKHGIIQIAIAPNIYNLDAEYIKKTIAPVLNVLEKDSLFSTLFEDKYCLLFGFTDEYSHNTGALEHNKSSVYIFNDTNDFDNKLKEFVAHEILHILTPLNLRSERIDAFDFNSPLFSKHLWLYEGVTEYLAMKANMNAKLIDTLQFFKQLRMNYNYGKESNIKSLTQFSENILDKRHQENYGAIYTQGAITAFYLDYLFAKESGGELGISDLLAYAMKSASTDGVFNEETFFQDLEDEFPIVKDFFENMIISSNKSPFHDYLNQLGVSFKKDTIQRSKTYFTYGLRRIDYRLPKYIVIKNQELNDSLGIKKLKIHKINGKTVKYADSWKLFSPKSNEVLKIKIKKGFKFKTIEISPFKRSYHYYPEHLKIDDLENNILNRILKFGIEQ